MKDKILDIIREYFWLICFIIGIAITIILLINSSYQREEISLIQYLIHIIIFFIIILGISFFPQKFRFSYLLMFASIIIIISYVCPKMSYAAIFHNVAEYYIYENIYLFPLVVLSICFAYRIGGGTSGICIKTGLNSVILLFSGFIDLMWFIVNNIDYSTYPVTIPHIKVILGFTPNLIQLFIFIFIHIILIIIIFILPFNKWIDKLFKIKEVK